MMKTKSMKEELIDEVDFKGNVIAIHPRSHFKERMFMHRVSLLIPMAENDSVLIGKRAKDKYPWPAMWCCAMGGKARSGESDLQTVNREMEEEFGKTFPVRKLTEFIYDGEDYKALFSLFTTTVPVSANDITLDKSETEYVKAFTLNELKQLISKEPKNFVPTFKAAIEEFVKYY